MLCITPLGAGKSVGKSCILLKIDDSNVLFDCGIQTGDFHNLLPSLPSSLNLDAIIISHFHLDHCGALPWIPKQWYNVPVFMTQPTRQIAPLLLSDFRKIALTRMGKNNVFSESFMFSIFEHAICLKKDQTISLASLDITCIYAGHVLGAGMFMIRKGAISVLYSGDYSTSASVLLAPVNMHPLQPSLFISEATFGIENRPSMNKRKIEFLSLVHSVIDDGGKVLIPVLAMGRVQDLCVLLENYWNQMGLNVPIYVYIGIDSRKLYDQFPFWRLSDVSLNFKHIKQLPLPESILDHNPMVLLSTPGMMTGGFSFNVFCKWCSNAKNAVFFPNYCSSGSIGHSLLHGAKSVCNDDNETVDVNCSVNSIAFTSHAEKNGIISGIRRLQPQAVCLVHGESQKLADMQRLLQASFDFPVYVPATGQTVNINIDLPSICFVSNKCIQSSTLINMTGLDFKHFFKRGKSTPLTGYLFLDESKASIVSFQEAIDRTPDHHQISFQEAIGFFPMPIQEFVDRVISLIHSEFSSISSSFTFYSSNKATIIIGYSIKIICLGHANNTVEISIAWPVELEELKDTIIANLLKFR